MRRPSWWEDFDPIDLPPRREPEVLWVDPRWTSTFPERQWLVMAWVGHGFEVYCDLCQRRVLRCERDRKKVREVWDRHITVKRHVLRALSPEDFSLGYRLDKRLARSVAIAVERGFG